MDDSRSTLRSRPLGTVLMGCGVALAISPLFGCGGDDEPSSESNTRQSQPAKSQDKPAVTSEQEVADAYNKVLNAIEDGDFDVICTEYMSTQARRTMLQAATFLGAKDCPSAYEAAWKLIDDADQAKLLVDAKAEDVKLTGKRKAVVKIANVADNGGDAEMVKKGDTWLLDAEATR